MQKIMTIGAALIILLVGAVWGAHTAFGLFLILMAGLMFYWGYQYLHNPKLPDGTPVAKWHVAIMWAGGVAIGAIGVVSIIYGS